MDREKRDIYRLFDLFYGLMLQAQYLKTEIDQILPSGELKNILLKESKEMSSHAESLTKTFVRIEKN